MSKTVLMIVYWIQEGRDLRVQTPHFIDEEIEAQEGCCSDPASEVNCRI